MYSNLNSQPQNTSQAVTPRAVNMEQSKDAIQSNLNQFTISSENEICLGPIRIHGIKNRAPSEKWLHAHHIELTLGVLEKIEKNEN